jgi:hypothetical protein
MREKEIVSEYISYAPIRKRMRPEKSGSDWAVLIADLSISKNSLPFALAFEFVERLYGSPQSALSTISIQPQGVLRVALPDMPRGRGMPLAFRCCSIKERNAVSRILLLARRFHADGTLKPSDGLNGPQIGTSCVNTPSALPSTVPMNVCSVSVSSGKFGQSCSVSSRRANS